MKEKKQKNKSNRFSILKKCIVAGSLCFVMAFGCFGLAGCSAGENGKDGKDGSKWFSGIETPLNTLGADGDFYLDTDDYILYQRQNGEWVVSMFNFGRPGTNGSNGADGLTPSIAISDDGYWIINGIKTTNKANGADGKDGQNGKSPVISINDDGFWVIDGTLTNVKARGDNGTNGTNGTNGKDGNTWNVGTEYPSNPKTGDMFLNNDTWDIYLYNGTAWELKGNIKGADGAKGDNGETPTIAINEDGFWVINGVVTDINARGNEFGDTLVSDPLSKDYFKNKKITIFGDSITVGVGSTGNNTGYAKLLGDILGANIENLGSNGTVMSTGTSGVSRINDLKRYSSETDYFIVALGTNDYHFSKTDDVKLGTLGSSDSATIYGAVYTYANILKEKFKDTNTKIYFLTPIYRADSFNTTSKNGFTIRDICVAIMETCEMFDIPVLDNFYASGIWSDTYAEDMADGVHPSDNGHLKMANSLSNFMLANYYYVEASQARTITLRTSTGSTKVSIEVGKTYTLPTPTYTDKAFVRWVGDNGQSYSGGQTITVNSNMVLAEVVSYPTDDLTVSVKNYYGGIEDTTNNKTINLEKNATLTESQLGLSEGYGLVANYYADANFTTAFDFSAVITASTTIYVNWQTDINCFTVDGSTLNGFSETMKSNLSNVKKLIFPQSYYYNSTDGTYFNSETAGATKTLITKLGNGGASESEFFGSGICTLSNSLDMLVIPEGVTTLGGFFFAFNGSFYSYNTGAGYNVYIPSTLTSYGNLAFVSSAVKEFIVASGNSALYTVDGSLFLKSNSCLVSLANAGITDGVYNLPNGTKVAVTSFYGNKSITDLTMGASSAASTTGLLNLKNLTITANLANSGADTYANFIACIISYQNKSLIGDDGHIYVNNEECKTALETALNNLKVDEVYNSGQVKITADIINTLKSKISVKAN